MYQKILVPLDGSELAECALPHVINLVKRWYRRRGDHSKCFLGS